MQRDKERVRIKVAKLVRSVLVWEIAVLMAACASGAYHSARNVAEALNNLHRTQAQAADWEGFQPGSSVTYQRVGKSRTFGTYREKVTMVMTERTPTMLKFETVLANGERFPWLPAQVDAVGLVAANSEKIGEEEVFIGSRKFHAEVYRFVYVRSKRSYEQTYWLAPGVPDGVIRHRERIEVDPTFTSESDMKITDLNVELKAGTKTLRGYCFETVEGARGGKFKHTRMCKSTEVPGAVVTGETTEMEGGQEESHVMQTVESFTVVR